jgi:hypothetical protein
MPPTNQQLALAALQRTGLSELDARRTLDATDPADVLILAQRQAALDEAEIKRRVEEEYAKTPAGIRERAAALQAAQDARQFDVEAAKTILAAQGAPVDKLTDDDLLDAAGLSANAQARREADAKARDLDANLAAAWPTTPEGSA